MSDTIKFEVEIPVCLTHKAAICHVIEQLRYFSTIPTSMSEKDFYKTVRLVGEMYVQ